MRATREVESTLIDRYQTTVQETVRRALRRGKRDKIHYTILPSRQAPANAGPPLCPEPEPARTSDPLSASVPGL